MKIFLSYRRDDTAGYAGRLADGLADHFGAPHIFRDVDSIPAGRNFVTLINEAVARCDVLVAVIGREWLDAANASGQRRLDDPEDFVRLEIAAALERNIPVVPVLVEGAAMPPPKALPPALSALSHQNALEVSDTRWDYDLGRLVEAIDPHTDAAPPQPRPKWLMPAAVTLAAAVVLLIIFGFVVSDDGEDGVRGGDVASVRIVRPQPFALGYPEVVEIEATGLPAGTVWYVLQPEGVEHYQPDHAPARVGNDRWAGEVWAGSPDDPPGDRYVLNVVVADEAASRAFTGYLERGQATGEFPGFDRLPDGARSVAAFVVTRR